MSIMGGGWMSLSSTIKEAASASSRAMSKLRCGVRVAIFRLSSLCPQDRRGLPVLLLIFFLHRQRGATQGGVESWRLQRLCQAAADAAQSGGAVGGAEFARRDVRRHASPPSTRRIG